MQAVKGQEGHIFGSLSEHIAHLVAGFEADTPVVSSEVLLKSQTLVISS